MMVYAGYGIDHMPDIKNHEEVSQWLLSTISFNLLGDYPSPKITPAFR